MDGRVGMALSHGCVRLEIQNAKWIYDTIPSGSTVVVYHYYRYGNIFRCIKHVENAGIEKERKM